MMMEYRIRWEWLEFFIALGKASLTSSLLGPLRNQQNVCCLEKIEMTLKESPGMVQGGCLHLEKLGVPFIHLS